MVGRAIGMLGKGLFVAALITGFGFITDGSEPPVATPAVADQTQSTDQAPASKKTETRIVNEVQPIAFTSSVELDPEIPAGVSEVIVAGVNGALKVNYLVTYQNGVESARVKQGEEVVQAPVNEVVLRGTQVAAPQPTPPPVQSFANIAPPAPEPQSANCDPNYTPCIPNVPGNAFNCPDIGVAVRVIGTDHHKFDGDGDGLGCESYR